MCTDASRWTKAGSLVTLYYGAKHARPLIALTIPRNFLLLLYGRGKIQESSGNSLTVIRHFLKFYAAARSARLRNSPSMSQLPLTMVAHPIFGVRMQRPVHVMLHRVNYSQCFNVLTCSMGTWKYQYYQYCTTNN